MGLLDSFKLSPADRKKIVAQEKRIDELEEALSRATGELKELNEKFQEMANLIAIVTSAQHQMSLDMNIIYENIQVVSTVLESNAQESDDRYFKWRWNVDDDDDLPN